MHTDKFSPYFSHFLIPIIVLREGEMFNFLFKDSFINSLADRIVEKITKEVNTSLSQINDSQDKKLNMVIEHIEQLKHELSSLDQRLTNKELKDKTEYGQMQYRISALQNDLKSKGPDKKAN